MGRKAFVWQAYPQEDGAHASKLGALLDWLGAEPEQALFHRVWNGLLDTPLPLLAHCKWAATAELAQQRARSHADLVTTLLRHLSRPATI